MRIDLFDINDFIKANNVPEVSNPIFFNFDRTPTQDGLFSYEIFGVSDTERKNIFGYINLNGRYIHPAVYSVMSGRMGNIKGIVTGERYAKLVDGRITIVESTDRDAETGVDFFYNNYEKINWISLEEEEDDESSLDKRTRMQFLKSLKNSKSTFFIDKWLVIPPFYREENSEDKTMGDSINKLYKELISRSAGMRRTFGFDLFGQSSRNRIQDLLMELYMESIKPIKGKYSLLRRHLIGKTVDFTASNVITSPNVAAANRPEDIPVPFGHGRFPIATLMALFHPFYVNFVAQFLENLYSSLRNQFYAEVGRINPNTYNLQVAEKLVKLYVGSVEDRFQPVLFEYTDINGKEQAREIMMKEYRSKADLDADRDIERPFTLTDLMYIITGDVVDGKHVYVTRYPVTNIQNIYPSKIKVMTTSKTRKLWIKIAGGILDFDEYPYVKFDGDPKPAPNTYYGFINVFVPGNTWLKSLGGDYDGDMLYMRGLFTKEANDEAARLVKAKSNLLNASGGPARGIKHIGKEAVMSFYEFTKDGK